MVIPIKLDPGAILPDRAHPTDAGLDLFSPKRQIVWPHSRHVIDTGVHFQIPDGYYGQLTSKSGLMKDHGITSEGTIDSSYRGSVKAVLFNHSDDVFYIDAGQKITQIIIKSCELPNLVVVNELDETDRGDGGFGSTGK